MRRDRLGAVRNRRPCVIVAWNLLPTMHRNCFGKRWKLKSRCGLVVGAERSQSPIYIAYCSQTNPVGVDFAVRAVQEILGEVSVR